MRNIALAVTALLPIVAIAQDANNRPRAAE